MAALRMSIIAALASAACGRVAFDETASLDAASSPCATCDVGLVAHWPLDETTGAIARDVVGGHDLMLTGDVLGWSSGVRAGAAAWTYGWGIADWNLPATVPAAFTIAMWQQPAAQSARWDRYFASYYWDGADHGAIEMDAGNRNGVRCIVFLGGGWEFAEAEGVFSPADWRHVACVYDGSELRAYGNGALVAASPVTGTLMSTEPLPVVLGASAYPDGTTQNQSSGKFDDARIYDRALTADELAALATR